MSSAVVTSSTPPARGAIASPGCSDTRCPSSPSATRRWLCTWARPRLHDALGDGLHAAQRRERPVLPPRAFRAAHRRGPLRGGHRADGRSRQLRPLRRSPTSWRKSPACSAAGSPRSPTPDSPTAGRGSTRSARTASRRWAPSTIGDGDRRRWLRRVRHPLSPVIGSSWPTWITAGEPRAVSDGAALVPRRASLQPAERE